METVLAIDEPEMVPKNADDTTLTLAGPPVYLPATTMALSMKNWPNPMRWATTPNNTKWKTTVETTHSVTPKIPSDGKYMLLMNCRQSTPGCLRTCNGIYGPSNA